MGLQGEQTAAWFQRAHAALVNGVSSGFRYWGPDDTMVIDRGEGAYVYDMDGNRYIDYQNGFGPIILGHGHPAVSEAVAEAAAEGIVFAMTQRREIEAAEVFLGAIPWADRLRFTNTGTEATMHAIRLARGLTGREVILKFEGQYHGAHDYVLFSTAGGPSGSLGSRFSPVPWQTSSGIPEGIRSYVRTLPFNDLELATRFMADRGHQVAAIIVEPMLGNLYGIMPDNGFLDGLRALCDQHGTLLIFDEVKTGFRVGVGGAEGLFGVTPDIGTFAKAMGNGFPVAAVAMGADAVAGWEQGGITQAGTYSGNGVAAAATRATIETLQSTDAFDRIERMGRTLMDGVAKVCADRGVAVQVMGVPAMFGLFFSDQIPRDFRDVGAHDVDLYSRVARGMIRRGVFPCDDAREPWFLSSALSDEDVALTLAAFDEALDEALG